MRVIAALAAALAATAGLSSTAGPASPPSTARPVEQTDAAASMPIRPGFFFELYRGHSIMGWGRDATACAYIDGVQLDLYPVGNDRYMSVLQAYQQEHGVRNITAASVRALGEFDMAPPADPVPHCPTPPSRSGI